MPGSDPAVRHPSAQRPVIGIGCDYEDQVKKPCSFVYLSYVRAVEKAGGLPVLIPALSDLSALPQLLGTLDGIVLTGSDDIDPAVYGEPKHPKTEPVIPPLKTTPDLALVRGAREREIPVFGICGGMQLVNVAFGGTLVQDIASQVNGALPHSSKQKRESSRHDVAVERGTLLAGILGAPRINVNSYHHQCVKAVGKGLKLTAWSEDGVPEALEAESGPFLVAVQWHPEHIHDEEPQFRLFRALVDAAAQRKR